MKRLLGIIVLVLLFSGCERIPADVKSYCGTKMSVLNANSDQAAKYAYEACVADEMEGR